MKINSLSKPGFVKFSYRRVLACGRVRSAVNVMNNSIVCPFILALVIDDSIFSLIHENSLKSDVAASPLLQNVILLRPHKANTFKLVLLKTSFLKGLFSR